MFSKIVPPRWLRMLFQIFAANYGEAWKERLSDDEKVQAAYFLWVSNLKDYDVELIQQAALQAVQTYSFPPTVSQFLEIIRPLSRHKRSESDSIKRLGGSGTPTQIAPPSPILADWMAKNPMTQDESFKKIFENFQGEELIHAIIRETKARIKHPLTNTNRDCKDNGDTQSHW